MAPPLFGGISSSPSRTVVEKDKESYLVKAEAMVKEIDSFRAARQYKCDFPEEHYYHSLLVDGFKFLFSNQKDQAEGNFKTVADQAGNALASYNYAMLQYEKYEKCKKEGITLHGYDAEEWNADRFLRNTLKYVNKAIKNDEDYAEAWHSRFVIYYSDLPRTEESRANWWHSFGRLKLLLEEERGKTPIVCRVGESKSVRSILRWACKELGEESRADTMREFFMSESHSAARFLPSEGIEKFKLFLSCMEFDGKEIAAHAKHPHEDPKQSRTIANVEFALLMLDKMLEKLGAFREGGARRVIQEHFRSNAEEAAKRIALEVAAEVYGRQPQEELQRLADKDKLVESLTTSIYGAASCVETQGNLPIMVQVGINLLRSASGLKERPLNFEGRKRWLDRAHHMAKAISALELLPAEAFEEDQLQWKCETKRRYLLKKTGLLKHEEKVFAVAQKIFGEKLDTPCTSDIFIRKCDGKSETCPVYQLVSLDDEIVKRVQVAVTAKKQMDEISRQSSQSGADSTTMRKLQKKIQFAELSYKPACEKIANALLTYAPNYDDLVSESDERSGVANIHAFLVDEIKRHTKPLGSLHYRYDIKPEESPFTPEEKKLVDRLLTVWVSEDLTPERIGYNREELVTLFEKISTRMMEEGTYDMVSAPHIIAKMIAVWIVQKDQRTIMNQTPLQEQAKYVKILTRNLLLCYEGKTYNKRPLHAPFQPYAFAGEGQKRPHQAPSRSKSRSDPVRDKEALEALKGKLEGEKTNFGSVKTFTLTDFSRIKQHLNSCNALGRKTLRDCNDRLNRLKDADPPDSWLMVQALEYLVTQVERRIIEVSGSMKK